MNVDGKRKKEAEAEQKRAAAQLKQAKLKSARNIHKAAKFTSQLSCSSIWPLHHVVYPRHHFKSIEAPQSPPSQKIPSLVIGYARQNHGQAEPYIRKSKCVS